MKTKLLLLLLVSLVCIAATTAQLPPPNTRTIIASQLGGKRIPANTVIYLTPSSDITGVIRIAEMVVPYSGTARNLFVRLDGTQETTQSFEITVFRNRKETGLFVLVPPMAPLNNYSDVFTQVYFQQGDRMTIRLRNNAPEPTAGVVSITLEYDSE